MYFGFLIAQIYNKEKCDHSAEANTTAVLRCCFCFQVPGNSQQFHGIQFSVYEREKNIWKMDDANSA
jgi:hypothetical protein